jgi:hypothetical protein
LGDLKIKENIRINLPEEEREDIFVSVYKSETKSEIRAVREDAAMCH